MWKDILYKSKKEYLGMDANGYGGLIEDEQGIWRLFGSIERNFEG